MATELSDDGVKGNGPCAACGHDPACGVASISFDGVERWFCHTDDHSCYAPPWHCDRCRPRYVEANMVNLDTEEAVCMFHFESEVD